MASEYRDPFYLDEIHEGSMAAIDAAHKREQRRRGIERARQEIDAQERRNDHAPLAPFSDSELRTVQRRIAALPAKCDWIALRNEAAKALSLRGLKGPGGKLATSIWVEALNRLDQRTEVPSMVFRSNLAEVLSPVDEAKRSTGSKRLREHKRGYYGRGHFKEVVAAVRLLAKAQLDFIGWDSIDTFPIVSGIKTPARVTSDGEVVICFNPLLLRLLQFELHKGNFTKLSTRDVHRLRTTRAVNLLIQLSRWRGFARMGKPQRLDVQTLRELFDMPAYRKRPSERDGRSLRMPTIYRDWKRVWTVLKAMQAEIHKYTEWEFEMETCRPGKQVTAVQFTIKKCGDGQGRAKPMKPRGVR